MTQTPPEPPASADPSGAGGSPRSEPDPRGPRPGRGSAPGEPLPPRPDPGPAPYGQGAPYGQAQPYGQGDPGGRHPAGGPYPPPRGPYAAGGPYPPPGPYPQPGGPYPQPGGQYPPPGGQPPPGYPGQYPTPYVPQQARPQTSGFAIAAFVVSLIGGWVVSLVLAFVALHEIKRSGRSGRGLAIAAVVLSFVWIGVFALGVTVALRWSPGRDTAGTVTRSGHVVARNLHTGDCITSVSEQALSVGQVGDLDVVPCTQAHGGEVIGSFELAEGPYPGEAKITDEADTRCSDLVPTAVTDSDLTDLSMIYLYPQRGNWSLGDRSVQCIVVSDGAPLTAPLPR